MPWQNWCVWAKYRTIVPKLGTPGKPCSSSPGWAAGESEQSQKSASFTQSYQLAGPGTQSEQSFVCPDLPACSTNKKNQS
tara:strand:+ start:285 stop:524 length:240 start_codon:yes stop_codon:yes gene_type:complete